MPKPGPPIVVTGMHRSGTSLSASILTALGVAMGEQLLPADAANPRGYFEDVEFLELDRRLVRDCTPESEAGHRDWGWTESERFDRRPLEAALPAARGLIAARAPSGRWGWKDPRASLLLEFWDDVLDCDACYLLVYRFPWEVADSMQRLGAEIFLQHPEYAYRIWSFYNRHLLEFHRRHRDRSLLVSVDALLDRLGDLVALVAGRFGLSGGELPQNGVFGRGQFRRVGGSDPLIGLVAANHPDCVRLLEQLDAAADLSGAGLWSAAPPSGVRLDGRRMEGPIDLSIVIPCHDDGELLIEAVASAERSAPKGSELIVVNDGSRQERTLEILAVLRRAGYHVIDQDNLGLSAARNRGICETRGRYLLPLDADNVLRPGFPPAALGVLAAAPEVGVVYGGRYEFGLRTGAVEVPGLDLDGMLRANYIDACAVFRREVWIDCGGYDTAMRAWEDWDFWLSAAERGWGFHRLPGITFDYRVRPGSMTSALGSAESTDPLRLYVFDKHHDLYRRRLPSLMQAQHETKVLRGLLADAVALTERLSAEQDRMGAERDRLYAELASWRHRVAAMEKTGAWRLRSLALRLRRWLAK